jgi:putative oxidoreductase
VVIRDGFSGDLALVAFRVTIGIVLLAHGYNHVLGGGRIAGTAKWFESLGMRLGRLHAWSASLTELVAGALLILGLAVPLAGAATIGVMLVAWLTNHRKNGFFIFRPGEGYEYVFVLTASGVVFAGLGGGRWSLDHLIGWELPSWAFLGFAALGVAGALAQLALFWRPGATAPPAPTDPPAESLIST